MGPGFISPEGFPFGAVMNDGEILQWDRASSARRATTNRSPPHAATFFNGTGLHQPGGPQCRVLGHSAIQIFNGTGLHQPGGPADHGAMPHHTYTSMAPGFISP